MTEWLEHPATRHVIASVILLVGVVVLRRVLIKALARSGLSPENRLRLTSAVRNLAFLVLAMGIVVIWAEELRAIALSLFALGVALVIATKELIQCVSGTIYRSSARPFAIGDRISIDGIRGDVVDINLFSTKIIEVGPTVHGHQRTGRVVVVPNSRLIDRPCYNESASDSFVVQTTLVAVPRDEDWKRAEAALLTSAEEICAEWMEQAQAAIDHAPGTRDFGLAHAEPTVMLSLEDPSRIVLTVRYPTPERKRGWVEQRILRGYLQRIEGEPDAA